MSLGQGVVLVIGGALILLLVLRIALSVPGWVRRVRRPEARSILIVGVGGGGSNAVDRMVGARIAGVAFTAVNTDAQVLRRSAAPTRIRIGDAITHGLGAGGDPEIGQRAAEEDRDRLADAVSGAALVLVTAGLGGGTGSGAAPVIAAAARDGGALTIGIVTKPFGWEGVERQRIAKAAAGRLAGAVDALIIAPNDRVSGVVAPDASLIDAFRAVDDVLLWTTKGIIGLINAPGLVNLDFADLRSVLRDAGPTLIGVGRGSGPDRALEAARQAAAGALLEADIHGATRILFSVAGPPDLGLVEVQHAAEEIRSHADPGANVIFGATLDPSLGADVMVTLIAAGLNGRDSAERSPARVAPMSTELPPERAIETAGVLASTEPKLRVAGQDPSPGTNPAAGASRTTSSRRRVGAAASPTIRPRSGGRSSSRASAVESAAAEGEDLDVPSYLRRDRHGDPHTGTPEVSRGAVDT